MAIDGTRMEANASRKANRNAEELAKEILDDAAAVDAEEDARLGDARGDELPAELCGSDRRARIRELLDELNVEAAERSYEAQLARRAEIEATTGRTLPGRQPKPDAQHRRSRQFANLTDPESRLMHTHGGYLQAYNAQAVATVDQFIVAAAVTNEGSDDAQFRPMVAETITNLRRAGSRSRVRIVVADAGYWCKDNLEGADVEALIAPGKSGGIGRKVREEARRGEVLARVERNEITRTEAAVEFGVGRSRIDQLMVARQPRHETLLPPRSGRRVQRMEADRRHAQHPQTLAAHPTRPGIGATRRRGVRTPTTRATSKRLVRHPPRRSLCHHLSVPVDARCRELRVPARGRGGGTAISLPGTSRRRASRQGAACLRSSRTVRSLRRPRRSARGRAGSLGLCDR